MKTPLTACVLALALCSGAHAQSWLEESNARIKELSRQQAPEWLKPRAPDAQTQEVVEEIADQGIKVMQAVQGVPAAKAKEQARKRFQAPLVLVSTSMPRNIMAGVLEEAAESGSTVVFRGVPKGQGIRDLIKYVSSFRDGKNIPTVTIDPTLFKRFGTEVPQVAFPIGDGSDLVTARGIVNIDWMARTIRSREIRSSADLGRQGSTWAAIEPDLVEEMKRRLATVNWDQKREAAILNFWKKRPYIDLPETRKDSEFTFDPTIVLEEDINNGRGTVIPAGTAINPLTRMTLSKRYIFFDATKPRQIRTAIRLNSEALAAGKPTSVIMTRFNGEDGWEGFEELNKRFNQPVFMLNSLIKDRFHLRSVPAYADAVGDRIRITEVAPDSGSSK